MTDIGTLSTLYFAPIISSDLWTSTVIEKDFNAYNQIMVPNQLQHLKIKGSLYLSDQSRMQSSCCQQLGITYPTVKATL